MDDDKREAELGAVLDAIAPGRAFRNRNNGDSPFPVRLFQAIARGQDAQVGDKEQTSYGRGIHDRDLYMILGEQARRKHDGLRLALKNARTIAVSVGQEILEDQVVGRIDQIKDHGAAIKALIEFGLNALGLRPSKKKRGTK